MQETTLYRYLRQHFGFSEFLPLQKYIIETVFRGKDCLAVMPTGSGKSLCYQLPAVGLDGTVIVISPLIALMSDQIRSLVQKGIAASALHSNLDPQEMIVTEQSYLNGNLKLLYVSPERMLSPLFLGFLERGKPSLFVIDEAHCITEWGHDFRPEYLRLAILCDRFPEVPKLALTATADEHCRQSILDTLKMPSAEVVIGSLDRPNLKYRLLEKEGGRQQILSFLAQHNDEAGIIYCQTRKRVEEISAWLNGCGYQALPYHAGLDSGSRADNQQMFLDSNKKIMVATVAFGMGIDKPDVRFVIHPDLPTSLEGYYQETGRAGRDGQTAETLLLYGLQDWMLAQKRIITNAMNNPIGEVRLERELQSLRSLMSWCDSVNCRRQGLLSWFSQSILSCGICDNCLRKPPLMDVSRQSQMALSCIYRCGQAFGASHLISVLRGVVSDTILSFAHDRLSTFGIGAEYSEKFWRRLFRTLLKEDLIRVRSEGFLTLRLTNKASEVLKGHNRVFMKSFDGEQSI